MSSLPPLHIKDFYDSEGNLRYEKVYEYLNSLFGATKANKTASITLKLPSLAIPAIYEQPTQNVSFDKNNLDPNIRPFTLYYFFNARKGKTHSIYPPVGEPPIIIDDFDSSGRFVFIVPYYLGSGISDVILFHRQSSKSFLRRDGGFSWSSSNPTPLSERFATKGTTGKGLFVGGKLCRQYKAMYPLNPMSRTLNYSRMGFQT